MNAIQQIIGWMPALLQATGVTLALSVTSVLTALVLAVFLALGKISKNTVLRSVCGAYIFFFRGTPLLMQLFFLYYTLPQLVPAFNIQSRFLAAWIAFFSPSIKASSKPPRRSASPTRRRCALSSSRRPTAA